MRLAQFRHGHGLTDKGDKMLPKHPDDSLGLQFIHD